MGEAMYEDGHTVGHAEMATSRFMFEIPFIAYLSPGYRKQRPDFAAALSEYAERPWQTDNLNYSLFTLAGITFEGFLSEQGCFFTGFCPNQTNPRCKTTIDTLFPEPFAFQ